MLFHSIQFEFQAIANKSWLISKYRYIIQDKITLLQNQYKLYKSRNIILANDYYTNIDFFSKRKNHILYRRDIQESLLFKTRMKLSYIVRQDKIKIYIGAGGSTNQEITNIRL